MRERSSLGNFLPRYYCGYYTELPPTLAGSSLHPDASQAPSGSQGWPSFVYPLGVSPHLPGERLPRAHLRAFTSYTHLQFSRFWFCVILLFVNVEIANSASEIDFRRSVLFYTSITWWKIWWWRYRWSHNTYSLRTQTKAKVHISSYLNIFIWTNF